MQFNWELIETNLQRFSGGAVVYIDENFMLVFSDRLKPAFDVDIFSTGSPGKNLFDERLLSLLPPTVAGVKRSQSTAATPQHVVI